MLSRKIFWFLCYYDFFNINFIYGGNKTTRAEKAIITDCDAV